MSQTSIKKEYLPECVEIRICLEKPPVSQKKIEEAKVEKKPINSELLNLFNKSKFNTNYFKELIPIENIRNQINYRNFGVY